MSARQFAPIAVLATAAVTLSATQVPGSVAGALVVGRVVDERTGRPIPRPFVSLEAIAAVDRFEAASGRRSQASSNQVVRGTADGVFVFASVPSGAYRILSSAAEYIDTPYGGYTGQEAGQVMPTLATSRVITVSAGERIGPLVISMSLSSSVQGTVRDERGMGVSGIPVRLLLVQRAGAVTLATNDAVSDDTGAYSFDGLTAGRYAVCVALAYRVVPDAAEVSSEQLRDMQRRYPASVMPSLAKAIVGGLAVALSGASDAHLPVVDSSGQWYGYEPTFYPAGHSLAEGAELTLEPGSALSGIDLVLGKKSILHTIAGTVVGLSGPAGYVALTLSPRQSVNGMYVNIPLGVFRSISGEDGTFAIPAVPNGSYEVKASRVPAAGSNANLRYSRTSAGELVIGRTEPQNSTLPAEPTLWGSELIAVDGANVEGVVVTTQAGTQVRGRLSFPAGSPRPSASTMQSMSVVLEESDPMRARSELGSRVHEDGSFETQGYPAGRYSVSVRGLAGWYAATVSVPGRDLTLEGISIDGSPADSVTVAMSNDFSAVRGLVTQGDGRPAAGAVAVMVPTMWQKWSLGGMSPTYTGTAIVRSDGTYVIPKIPPGDYLLVVTSRGESLWNLVDQLRRRRLEALSVHVATANVTAPTVRLLSAK